MTYNRHDLKDLIDRLCLDKDILDHQFGYTDPKLMERKLSGKAKLTERDQTIIAMLSESEDDLTEIPGTGFYE